MTREEVLKIITEVSIKHGVDPLLVQAIASVESGLCADPCLVRFEPHYRWTFSPRELSDNVRAAGLLGYNAATEEALQKFSYGLLQVMGAVMRENGYYQPFQEVFADPRISLDYGVRHLKKFLKKYASEEDAVSAYNQGSNRKTAGGMYMNQVYVDKVFSRLRKLRELKDK